MKTYSCSVIADFLEVLTRDGYSLKTVKEGILGYGHIIALAPSAEWQNVEIKEIALNEWSSAHTVRGFRKISKRIQDLLDNPA